MRRICVFVLVVLSIWAASATGRTYRTDLTDCSELQFSEGPDTLYCWDNIPSFIQLRVELPTDQRTSFETFGGTGTNSALGFVHRQTLFNYIIQAFDYPQFLRDIGDPNGLTLTPPRITVTRGLARALAPQANNPFDLPLLRINWFFDPTIVDKYPAFKDIFEPPQDCGLDVCFGVQLVFFGDGSQPFIDPTDFSRSRLDPTLTRVAFELNGLRDYRYFTATLIASSVDACGRWDISGNTLCAFRAYVSSKGNDSNPCTVQLPCRLLPAALAVLKDGGEVWMLDSANYNAGPVDIARSVTIRALPGVVGSLAANNPGDDVIIVSGLGIHVSLKNLAIVNLNGGFNGINFKLGAELTVESCEIAGMLDFGIRAETSNGTLTVRDTVIRDGLGYGAYVTGNTNATWDGVHLLNNSGAGLVADGNARVTVSNSVIASNGGFGVNAAATGGSTVKVTVDRSVLRANGGAGLQGLAGGPGDRAQVVATGNTITHNGDGVTAASNGGGIVTMVLGGNAITNNNIGVHLSGAGSTVYTRKNNTAKSNATDLSGGAPTVLPGS